MELDPRTMRQESTYKLLIGCVVPRPIAWVSTVGPDGVNNLAPFSFFMGVCQEPPTIAFSSGPRAKNRKDTVRNAEHTGDFVVNVVDDDLAEQMNLSSGDYPPELDEFALTGLTAAPGVRVRAPRVAQAPISLECRVAQIIPWAAAPTAWAWARSSTSTCVTISTTRSAGASTWPASSRWAAWPATSTRTSTTSSR
jgi:flavin reductase (DIM6/NTAB) family NADH-FMN oxidoreductase RutF